MWVYFLCIKNKHKGLLARIKQHKGMHASCSSGFTNINAHIYTIKASKKLTMLV